MKIEYLVTFNIKGNFLENVDNFKNLLMSHSSVCVNENQLLYKDTNYDFEIFNYDITDQNQRLFKIILIDNQKKDIDVFLELLKIMREIVYKTEGKITIIWDEISNYYSCLAYPEINKIENLLRKLISYFMISKLGDKWNESIPKELKNNIKNPRGKNNFLHDTDFIQLVDYLFKPYPNKNIEIFFRDFKKRTNIEDLKIEYFYEFIPRSNWERYFSAFVECEDRQLQKKWERLYELRCLIAHNSFISKEEFYELNLITTELNETFEKAILSIDQIIIPSKEKEFLLENVESVNNELLEEYFKEWHLIYESVKQLSNINVENLGLKSLVEDLVEKEILSVQFYEDLIPLGVVRNKITELTDSEIIEETEKLSNFYFHKIKMVAPFTN